MTEEAMNRWVREYFAETPEVGRNQATGVPVATFRAITGKFDADGDFNGTPIDTVTIMMGETVAWTRLIGTHTVTSGADTFEVGWGSLFNVALDGVSGPFEYTFNDPGTFPFFCLPHLSLNMTGAVIVEGSVGVTPLPGPGGAIGFTRGPSPNPSRGTSSFRFALPVAGRATARVYDARGRMVAELMDRHLQAGSYGALWDGRDRAGNLAAPGVYFVSLVLPDHRDSRRVVLSR
jgi:plastocyanin